MSKLFFSVLPTGHDRASVELDHAHHTHSATVKAQEIFTANAKMGGPFESPVRQVTLVLRSRRNLSEQRRWKSLQGVRFPDSPCGSPVVASRILSRFGLNMPDICSWWNFFLWFIMGRKTGYDVLARGEMIQCNKVHSYSA